MNPMKMCNVLLAMVLTGGLMSHAQVSSAPDGRLERRDG